MCRLNRLLFLALSCLAWLLLAPAVTWSAEVLAEPKSSDDMTPQPLLGSPSETPETPKKMQPTPSSTDLSEAWALLKNEWREQGVDSETLLKQLVESRIETEEAMRLLTGSISRCANLESSLQIERMGKEVAVRAALVREQTANRERDFWRGVGIGFLVVGLGALGASLFF